MKFPRLTLREELKIRKLISFYYMELSKSFVSIGEKHNFWEFIYVDKGEIHIVTEGRSYLLKQGDMLFYKPNDFHTGHANRLVAPNLIIISFECDSPCMSAFEYRPLHLTDGERHLLSEIIRAGIESFDSPHLRSAPPLRRNENAPFGSEQLIRNYLEILLLQLIRRTREVQTALLLPASGPNVESAEGGRQSELTRQIIEYMNVRLGENLTLETLCRAFGVGKSRLKSLFKAETGCGPIAYFNHRKIAEAKKLIREEQRNFTEIAELLGYSGIHYFSTQFKKTTRMTPSEYAKATGAKIVRTVH
ncbi:AraC family transcriptional regulator [Cohnella hashimotonis]|uniref:AraC family transcriptional regulator n=1 Tax=Cohnella hashimotonis TaxID=2826895 RepID=A0ABT6TIZ8_9BACL|nr:AraC family transcriptional regulator [Cohnella hashimotonis]MDI4645822.1 AraC family transcriptional regulator [Cohnella hashimotonis]